MFLEEWKEKQQQQGRRQPQSTSIHSVCGKLNEQIYERLQY